MDDRTLARTAVRLLQGGVAPRHVRRSVEELKSHRSDLIGQLVAQGYDADSAPVEADVRLGDPHAFVAAALARPELRGWASRAPWLVFVLAPAVAFVALGIGLIALVIAGIDVAGPIGWRYGSAVLTTAVQWVLPLGVFTAMAAISWRSHRPAAWPAVGLMLVTALTAVVTVQLVGPLQVGQKGQLSVGAGFPPRDALRVAVLTAVAVAGGLLLHLRPRFAR